MRGGGDNFMDNLGICLFGEGSLCFRVALDGLVPMGFEIVAVALVDLTSKFSSVIFMIVEGS